MHLSAGVWVIHTQDSPLFTTGQPDRGQGLQQLAEIGNATILGSSIASNPGPGVISSSVFGGIIVSGQATEFSVSAIPGQRLSFATMLGESTDWFFGPGDAGISLFTASGTPISGDVTSQIMLWDCGTSINGEPAVAARTNAPDPDSRIRVIPAPTILSFPTNPAFPLPAVSNLIRVTLTPNG